jgi:predicted DNA-binding transcriptional regulator AlpA
LLTQIEAAKALGVTRDVLYAAIKDGSGPMRLRLGKRFYYPKEGINRWLKSGAAVEAPTPAAVPAPVVPKPAPAAPVARKPEKQAPDLSCYGGGQRQVRTVEIRPAMQGAASRRNVTATPNS